MLRHELDELPARLFVRHIPGHQDPTQCDDPVASWSSHWNQADLAAKAANNHRSTDAFTAAQHHMEASLGKLQRLRLDIAEATQRRQPAGDEDEDDPSTTEIGCHTCSVGQRCKMILLEGH